MEEFEASVLGPIRIAKRQRQAVEALAREAVRQARRDEMAGPRPSCQCNAAREGVTHVLSATLPAGTHQLWVDGELMTVTNDLAR